MNQRRRLLNLARKGDPKAITRLFDLYQVRVYSGDTLSKAKRLPTFPVMHEKSGKAPAQKRTSTRSRGSRVAAAAKSSPKMAHR